jgi:hypothetical protein
MNWYECHPCDIEIRRCPVCRGEFEVQCRDHQDVCDECEDNIAAHDSKYETDYHWDYPWSPTLWEDLNDTHWEWSDHVVEAFPTLEPDNAVQ